VQRLRRVIGEHRDTRGRMLATAMALSIAAWAATAPAEQPVAVSASEARQVYVSGVKESFAKVKAAVEQAAAESGRKYRVIVVGDAGGESDGVTRLLDSLVERWRQETESRPGGGPATAFDPARDVTIVLGVADRQIAMRAPWGLEVSSGLDPETIKSELITKVFVPKAKDKLFDEGLADLVAATEKWVKDRTALKAARAEATRVFYSRTLPLTAAGLLGFGALAAFFLQRARHDRKLHEARKKLAAFKNEVVSLSDLLDTQQERHRMLPHTDPDFKTPMQGLTRSTYDTVQSAIRRYRERWLVLMDVWEKAEGQINSEWFLGTAAADEAIRLLDSAEARPPLEAVAGECRAPLDALEKAHETARGLVDELSTRISAAGGRLDAIAARGRSQAVFQPAVAEASRSLDAARHDLENDPVAARGRLDEASSALDRMLADVDRFEATDDRRSRAAAEADSVEQAIRAKRSEGWRLDEPGAVPDELVATARKNITLAAQLLDAGQAAGALAHVEQAEQANAEASALVENIVAARKRIEDLLPGCIARLAALAEQRGKAMQAIEHLAAAYAEASWADVADNIGKADEGVERASLLVKEAQAAVAAERQHYFRGVALVDEALRQEEWAEGCYQAISDRRAELDQLAGSLPRRRDTVASRVAALGRQLERQRTDRVRANERCREADRLVDAASRGLAATRPDLRQVVQVIDAADAAAARATELAAEDERLARQAFSDLEETDGVVRRVAAWYAEGVSADVQAAHAGIEAAKRLLSQQRYEESIHASAEAARVAKEAYAAAAAEADRRRQRRQLELQRRSMEEAFTRMSRGFGPWVINLPGGTFTGPDPWRSIGAGGGARMPSVPSPRTARGGWSTNTVQVGW
jgi:hypothetical protein